MVEYKWLREHRFMNNSLLPTISISSNKNIEDCIYSIRGQQVMLDSDIAVFLMLIQKE